jgi:hypothetical protein
VFLSITLDKTPFLPYNRLMPRWINELFMKVWDKIDEQAEREGKAITALSSYSPKTPNVSKSVGVPRRIFTNGLCYRIERLSPSDFLHYLKNGELKTL